jgi:two-component system alkaline phosphatase synthesis response regulator PhoP
MRLQRILAVDDDVDILELLKYNFDKEGFKVKVVEDSTLAVKTALTFKPDLIILDIMMPRLSGIEVCKQLRALAGFKDTPIFFLTAKSENYYEEAVFETGGDDFIEKIIGLRALTHKVIAVLREGLTIKKSISKINVGLLHLNRRNSVAKIRGEEIALSKPELDLLFFFAQNSKKVITSENLLNNIWGSEVYSIAKSLDSYIDNLSKKLGNKWISQVGNGKYKFNPH